jgi:hypothetical protein
MQQDKNNGGPIDGIDVTSDGVLVLAREPVVGRKGIKVIVLTNSSDTGIYLALKNSPDGATNQAEAGKGIYLTANGGAYECNETNMCISEIWAIHEAVGETKRLCLQICR